MEITWLGHACFRLKGRDSVVLMDPCPKSTGYNIGRQQANIVTISHPHPDHSHTEAVTGSPRLIDAPGEYEIGGVLLTGVRTYHDDKHGKTRGPNTTFLVEVDEVRICHLGDLGHVPTQEQSEALSDIDVLLVPVGGHTTIDAEAASEIISQIEPRLVVPMHYATEAATAKLDPLDKFIKQMGVSAPQPQPKLSLTRSGLPAQTQVVVLEYRR
jgi:L-ascorbate metabolism protein UlaG (beta-lactamase superfamily)